MQSSEPVYTNRLILEKSPYLLQHAHNPVSWFPWGPEAWAKARTENKVIFLSIGYSTCHWCHVMERESFENEEIAALLNKDFISVKVDREERPDIDHVYMSAVQAMNQSGGWPLTVFLTPDLKPFMGGSYFPPEDRWGRAGMKNLLPRIAGLWQERRVEILESSEKISYALQPTNASADTMPDISAAMEKAFHNYRMMYDPVHGGFGQAPKFPSGHNLSFLLWYSKRSKNKEALQMVEHTLQKMARGGMYDQLGGGFHRYSTDGEWLAPHFEKMLYDQAILTRVYLEAWQVTQTPFYSEVARDILNYVSRDMTHPEGGFFSAQDADSEGIEGKFYVWNSSETKAILGDPDAQIFNLYYDVTPQGNFEHATSILRVQEDLESYAARQGMSVESFRAQIQVMRGKVYHERKKRIPPLTDDKILTGWNGLMISAFALGASALGDSSYAEIASRAADFVLSRIQIEGRLLRRFRDGETSGPACHEDYAYLILGLLDLYEATFKLKWLKEAKRLAYQMLDLFEDVEAGGFFYTAKDSEKLIALTKDYYDGAVPSSNSVSAWVLARLARICGESVFGEAARKTLLSVEKNRQAHPSAFPWLLMSRDLFQEGSEFVVLSLQESLYGENGLLREIQTKYFPNKILVVCAGPNDYSELKTLVPWIPSLEASVEAAAVYICRNQTCQLPIFSRDALRNFLR
ncbi:MAG: thioredoxin domain-containing protein [Candidatus Omnitrophica bacterium]|nr:thioredoxin domain-containing protein [Candidatus Omnitrophota bacterium]